MRASRLATLGLHEPRHRVRLRVGSPLSRRGPAWVSVAVLLSVSVASCSSTGGAAPSGSSSRPLTQLDHANRELEQVSSCLQKAGWKVKLDPGRGYSAEVPEAQRTAYRADREKCEKEFLDQYPRPEMTEADWKKLYQHQLWLVKCLEGEGYPPVSTPPSEADYVADGLSGTAPSWFAWEAVGGAAPPDLEAKCPQAPPGL